MGMRFAGRRQYRAGGPFIARKAFTFAGAGFKTGDDFPAEDIAPRVIERLFRSNMIDMKPGEIEGGETERVVLDALPTMTTAELGNLLRHEIDVRRQHYRRRLVEAIEAEIARRADPAPEPPQDAQETPAAPVDDDPAPDPFIAPDPDPLRADAPPKGYRSELGLGNAAGPAVSSTAESEGAPSDPTERPATEGGADESTPAAAGDGDTTSPVADDPPKPPPIPGGSKLILMRKDDLVLLAAAYDLSTDGTKAELVNRLNEARDLLADAEGA